ncbi:hypothetical protein NN3_05670 [Nocardia neocaledoniensis NBRC 108232]|nr:hypothetical protein NN3_05670 [Nocardia neocaledoniensis NBRC 108232]
MVERLSVDLGGMLTWISLGLTVAGSLATVVLKSRAYLLAFYLWRKTRDIEVLQEVARFDRIVR